MQKPVFETHLRRFLTLFRLDYRDEEATVLIDECYDSFGRAWTDEMLAGALGVLKEQDAKITRGTNLMAKIKAAGADWLSQHPEKQAPQYREQQARGACPELCENGWLRAYRADGAACGVVAPCYHCMPHHPMRKSRRQLENYGYRVHRPGESPLRVQTEVCGQAACMGDDTAQSRDVERAHHRLMDAAVDPQERPEPEAALETW